MKLSLTALASAWLVVTVQAAERPRALSPLDEYRHAAREPKPAEATAAPGSLYSPSAMFADLTGDLRARRAGDIVTIVVADRASAVAKGSTNSSRKSDLNYSVGSFLGKPSSAGALANLAKGSGEAQLQGQGQTSRETMLSTTLSARVVEVLPDGNLVLEGSKLVQVNSEQQWVTVRGLARPADIQPGNQVRSDRLAYLEIRVNGKGVVGDAVRRPFILYRLLLGILPL